MSEQIIEGSVDVIFNELVDVIEQQNTLIKHQNTILSRVCDELIKIRGNM
ncbi:MAG: hypothetical protein UHM08_08675 [Bacteroidales bacterium]|nr:hypothetical protein [Bacteroidales bacterium]